MSSLATRLYNGEAGIGVVPRRKLWYAIAAGIFVIAILSFYFRGFNLGIEFAGGNSFEIQQKPGISLQQAKDAVSKAGAAVSTGQSVGGKVPTYLIRTAPMDQTKSDAVQQQVAKTLNLPTGNINQSRVSPAWGSQITGGALRGLVAFLVLVIAYLAFRFEWRMALGAIVALITNLITTAAIYSLVGFDVTPSTVIGMLTILGFSLYDVVVVFDKVQENTAGILGGARTTYAEAANLAVNQTLMRSINTAVIALLPVGGLLFIGAGLLGAGTLKDLGLVLFVGMGVAVICSIFLATPVVVDLKNREPKYAALEQRVLARRAGAKSADKKAAAAEAVAEPAVASSSVRAGAGTATRTATPPRKKPATKQGRPSGAKKRR
ncbi:MAG: protein translocase subunit SecF [Actinomycetia bacterium]|nr:protein translocase subunit SecF [Actinomycetes bacterium]